MNDTDPRRIRQMFEEISPRYDFLNHLLSMNLDRAWRREVSRRCPSHGTILDVCTGTGDLAFAIRREGRTVIGADFTHGMLRLARGKSRQVPFLAADTLRLPFRDNTFEATTVAFGIRNTADPLAALQEMRRVVKPGGKVLVLEFAMPRCSMIARPYLFYFRHILPLMGNAISQSRRNAYGYLNASAETFPAGESFLDLMRQAGLGEAQFQTLTLGTVMLYTGRKI